MDDVNKIGSSNVSVNVATWNILADALSKNEFATKGGDVENLAWIGHRGDKIAQNIIDMFCGLNMAIVMTQENDHPQWLLQKIQSKVPSVQMCLIDAGKDGTDKPTKYQKFYTHRLIKAIGKDKEFPKPPKTLENLTQQYEACNQWLQNANEETRRTFSDNGCTCTTNRDEGVISSDNNGDDWYIPSADVGTVIYYDTSQVSMIKHDSDHDCLDFTTASEGIPFTVYGAHLKSGVDLKSEDRRCKELHKLLSHAQNKLNPILLMDSNSCLQYQRDLELELEKKKNDNDIEIPEWTTDVIKKYNFVDLVANKGNECLKMRHFDTDQPKKAGQFMFDTIDKILISKTSGLSASKFLPIVTDSSRAYPLEYYDDYVKLRNVPSLRSALKQTGSTQKWQADLTPVLSEMTNVFASFHVPSNETDTLQHDVGDLMSRLMPNAEKVPSDHPPVGATVILNRIEEVFSPPKVSFSEECTETSKNNAEKMDTNDTTSKVTTTPISLRKPSVSSDVIGDGSFESLMKERAKLRKEKDEHSIAELRVSLTNTERSLSREIKRRIESQSYIEKLCDEKVAATEERLHTIIDQHVEAIQERLKGLDSKVNDLNARLEEEKAAIPADIAKRSNEIKDMLQNFIDEFSVERRDRLNREGRIMKQLTDHAELLSAQWNEERQSREDSVSMLTEKLNENDRNRSEADANFANLVDEEVQKLREEIEQEGKERSIEDDEIVEALNRYTEHLQNSLSVISTVSN